MGLSEINAQRYLLTLRVGTAILLEVLAQFPHGNSEKEHSD